MYKLIPTPAAGACRIALAILAAGGSSAALAEGFTLDNGVEGQWSLNMTMGAGVRATDRDPNLVSVANGGTAGVGNGHDDGNLNFNKGTAFSSGPKITGELRLKKDNVGMFVRATGWYDYTLENKGVAHGSYNNGYVPGARLSDDGFDRLSTFSGAALADAYVFGTTDVAPDMPLTVKAGNQVVNWGESTFIPGINAMGAFDLTAAHRPGAQVKEILRPIPQITANLGTAGGLSFEGFYQLRWTRTVLDGCGTYWSMADSLNCPNGAVVFGDSLGSDRVQYTGAPVLAALPPALLNAVGASSLAATPINFRLGRAPEVTPKNSGQFGLSSHYFAEALSTDFGLYFTNYHARTPTIGVVKTPSATPSIYSGAYAGVMGAITQALTKAGNPAAKTFGLLAAFPGAEMDWNYGAENIHAIGLSAATEAAGFSLFGEASYTQGIPAQINAPDLLVGSVLGIGPMASLQKQFRDPGVAQGSVLAAYDRKNKTQVQMSFIRLLPQVLGASQLQLMGEVGAQHWDGIGDPNTSTRYGRGFLFGFGPTAALGGTCAGLNGFAGYCENKGYATSFAWGYRLQGELTYSDVFAGVNLKPRVFWSQDVKGYSVDNTFVEDRRNLGLAVRADYNSRYYAELSYSRFNHNAKYDIFHDRDNYAAVLGINF